MKDHLNTKIAILGGDRRYLYLSEKVAAIGFNTYHLFASHDDLEGAAVKSGDYHTLLPQCQAIILPMPVSRDGIRLNTPLWPEDILMSDCFRYMTRNTTVIGGLVTSFVAAEASAAGIAITDLLETEELAVRNALPTAEGALQIAMEETPYTIFGSRCVIAGYGRISRLLARMLRDLGAEVTVTTRKSEHMAWIAAEGYKSCHTAKLCEVAADGDIFFNTVPSPVFTKAVLGRMRHDALVIDLASMPGGGDGRVGGPF
ncbi:MAG: dipicolinate synthase subunit DpsA [Angelakisella sp.]